MSLIIMLILGLFVEFNYLWLQLTIAFQKLTQFTVADLNAISFLMP
jgi:hypothetical protein